MQDYGIGYLNSVEYWYFSSQYPYTGTLISMDKIHIISVSMKRRTITTMFFIQRKENAF